MIICHTANADADNNLKPKIICHTVDVDCNLKLWCGVYYETPDLDLCEIYNSHWLTNNYLLVLFSEKWNGKQFFLIRVEELFSKRRG